MNSFALLNNLPKADYVKNVFNGVTFNFTNMLFYFQKQKINKKSAYVSPLRSAGFGLIEILIASAILSASLITLTATSQIAFSLIKESLERTQAGFLAEETVEAVRTIRDTSWSLNLAPLVSGAVYYPTFNATTSAWALGTTTPSLIYGLFERTIVFNDVYRRNSDGEIVDWSSPDPKTFDPDTKKITTRVAWGNAAESAISFTDGTTDGDLANFPANNSGDGDPAESFITLSEAITVPVVELLLEKAPGTTPSNIYLEIRSGSTVGSVLGTSFTIDASTISESALVWTSFSFPSSIALSAGTQYFLRLRSIPDSTQAFSGSSGIIHWGYKQTAGSPYAGGDGWRYVGRLGNENDTGQKLDQYDFSFRVYKDGAFARDVIVETYITNLFQN